VAYLITAGAYGFLAFALYVSWWNGCSMVSQVVSVAAAVAMTIAVMTIVMPPQGSGGIEGIEGPIGVLFGMFGIILSAVSVRFASCLTCPDASFFTSNDCQ